MLGALLHMNIGVALGVASIVTLYASSSRMQQQQQQQQQQGDSSNTLLRLFLVTFLATYLTMFIAERLTGDRSSREASSYSHMVPLNLESAMKHVDKTLPKF